MTLNNQDFYIVGELQLRKIEEGYIISMLKKIRSQKVSIHTMVESGAISQRVENILREKMGV